MKRLLIYSTVFATMFNLILFFSSKVSANETEPFCYFTTQSNRVLDWSSICLSPRNKVRLNKKRNSMKKVNRSKIQPPQKSHYPPSKFPINKFKIK